MLSSRRRLNIIIKVIQRRVRNNAERGIELQDSDVRVTDERRGGRAERHGELELVDARDDGEGAGGSADGELEGVGARGEDYRVDVVVRLIKTKTKNSDE